MPDQPDRLGANEGLRVLDDFICEAIPSLGVPLAASPGRGVNAGIQVLSEIVVRGEPMTDLHSLPLAEPGREECAKELFPYGDMSPEEYVARLAHTIGCSSFDLYRYRDRDLEAWIHRAHQLLGNLAEIERCRLRHLTPEELERIHREERSHFEAGAIARQAALFFGEPG